MPEDIATAIVTDIVKKIGTTDRTLKCLNSYDLATLLREYRRIEKGKLIENLNTVGADAAQKMVDLQAFDEDPPSNWIRYLNTLDGQLHAIRLSLLKTYPDAADIIKELDWPLGEMVDAIVKLCGLRVVGPPTEKPDPTATYGDGGADPNPQTPPAVYQTPAATTSTSESTPQT